MTTEAHAGQRHAAPLAPFKRGPAPQWQQQIEAIAKLAKARQRFFTEMLQTVLVQR